MAIDEELGNNWSTDHDNVRRIRLLTYICESIMVPAAGTKPDRVVLDIIVRCGTSSKNLDIEIRNMNNMRHAVWVLRLKAYDEILVLLKSVSSSLHIVIALVNGN